MKRLFLLSVILALGTCLHADDTVRQRLPLDDNWKFILGDPDKAADPGCDDSSWRTVTVPHDWGVEGKIDAKATMGGGGGFFPSGLGWYRQQIDAPASWQGKRVEVEFEGIYMNADVYLNGQKLDNHPYGYTTFFVNLTPALKPGAANLLAVRVDNSKQKNSRWYAGSGIYRHVWLHVMGPVHVADWGNFVSSTQVDSKSATISVQTKVTNETTQAQTVKVHSEILGPDGVSLGASDGSCDLPASGSASAMGTIALNNPPLWSPETPQISKAVTTVLINGQLVDTVTTDFGVRELKWSVDKGLTLNGTTYKLKGGCIHDDNGVLGAAAFDRAEQRKIELLKAAGFTAIRMAHNPPSPALLDACDRLGILVMDEVFDCWTAGKNSQDYKVYFKDWWQRDLDSMVLRDRNHPSIVIWNIGNEIPGMFNSDEVSGYSPKLVDEIHSLDKTRPVTNAILGWPGDFKNPKPSDADNLKRANLDWDCLDVVGSNYAIHNHVMQHSEHPDRVLVSTESYPPLGAHNDALNNVFVIGDFSWSAEDYLGEAGVGRWFYLGDPTEPVDLDKNNPKALPRPIGHGNDKLYPWHGANSGVLDILGNEKPAAAWWADVWQSHAKIGLGVEQPETDDKPVLVAGWGWYPTWFSWTWPGWEGKAIKVEVYTTRPTARLYLNGTQVGELPTKDARAIFTVTYQPGVLKAVGVDNGQEMETAQLATAGPATYLRLTPDRTVIKADGEDLSFVSVEVLDKDGNIQPNADNLVRFTLAGAGTIAGLGNANLKCEDPYQGTECHVFHGKALIVLRSTKGQDLGLIQLKADADGLSSGQVAVTTH